MARAMPVLPLVGSTSVVRPGAMTPACSAASIIDRPMRSLTLPPGLNDSSLPTIVAPLRSESVRSRTSGVPPISLVMSSAMSTRSFRSALLDVVHGLVRHAGALALGEIGDRGLTQHPFEGLLGLEPHRGRSALLDAFTLALRADRRRDQTVEDLDDLEDGDLGRRTGEEESAAGPAAAVYYAGPPQRGEELLEKLQRIP